MQKVKALSKKIPKYSIRLGYNQTLANSAQSLQKGSRVYVRR